MGTNKAGGSPYLKSASPLTIYVSLIDNIIFFRIPIYETLKGALHTFDCSWLTTFTFHGSRSTLAIDALRIPLRLALHIPLAFPFLCQLLADYIAHIAAGAEHRRQQLAATPGADFGCYCWFSSHCFVSVNTLSRIPSVVLTAPYLADG